MPRPSTDATPPSVKPDTLELVHQAIGALGAATAAEIAAHAGIAYSTVTPKLRILADVGRAEFFHGGDGRGKWRTTTQTDISTNHAEPSTPVEPTTPPAQTPADDTTNTDITAQGDETVPAEHVAEVDTKDTDEVAAPAATEPAAEPTPAADGEVAGIAPAAHGADTDSPAVPRRRKGTIPKDLLAVMQTHPDTAYKVGELSVLLGGTSMGAIANALHKLVIDGTVTQTVEKPATFQAL
jgi:hypothetical protein